MWILTEICILKFTFVDYIWICILIAIHTFWRKCAFRETHLYLHFNCNVHILEDVRAFGGSRLHLYFSCNIHLFWRRCILKYNYIHIFTEKIILIKYYCNLYHILLRIEENKTNFTSWMHETHSNSLTSHFKWDAIN